MPRIKAHDGYLTVFNMFTTDSEEHHERLLEEMRKIIDNGNGGRDFTGWLSSTLHAGQAALGTANYIQWRSLHDLENRYAGRDYKNETVPLFKEISTSVNLLKTEVVFSQHHPDLEQIEISPDRDDWTVIIVMEVAPENQQELVDLLGRPDEWIKTVPGYRSHSICRGIDGTFIILYAQWASEAAHNAFHHMPEAQRPADQQEMRAAVDKLVTARRANTYRVVHSRAAQTQATN
ncbi:antibiotic biosynthesis monooxygenase family protein [Streptomyces sp. NPDC017993]|uniref:antibiotic biosynthesis monooxygenase family protein n=1 Tax=Streptomyces sp. NPDC017993 TaxID=3365027 RepID=UPI0037A44000